MKRSSELAWWLGLCAVGLLALGCPSPSGTGSREASRASISGHVVLVDEPGLSDLSRVRVDLGRGEGSVVVDENGDFSATDLEPDVYTFTVTYVGGLTATATRSAYIRWAQRVVARAGGDINLGNVELQLARGSVRGSVVATQEDGSGGSTPASPAGTEVQLTVRGQTRTAVVLPDGTFGFPDVPVGAHAVKVQRPAFLSGASACAGDVTVAELDDQPVLPAVQLVRPLPSLVPGAGQVLAQDGLRWFVAGNATDLTVNALVSQARSARAWRDGSAPGDFVPGTTPGSAALVLAVPQTPGDAVETWNLQFADGCGNATEPLRLTVLADRVAPAAALSLNQGAPFTSEATVSARLLASDALSTRLEMRFLTCAEEAGVSTCTPSADFTETDPPFIPWAASSSITFAGTPGPRTVRAQVRDQAGNISETALATIVWDGDAPARPVVVLGRDGIITSPVSSVTLMAPPDAAQMRYGTGQEALGPWRAIQPIFSVAFSPDEGAKTLNLQVRDAAGNESEVVATTVTLRTRGVLRGGVLLEGGGNPEGTLVTLDNGMSTVASADGAFVLLDVPAGNRELSLVAPTLGRSYASATVTAVAQADATVDLSPVQLRLVRGTLSGRVQLQGEATHAGISITLEEQRPAGESVPRSTNALGGFGPVALAVGTWTVRAEKLGFASATLGTVVVEPNALQELPPAAAPPFVLERVRAGLVLINGGAAFTDSRSVVLILDAPEGTSQVRFANSPAALEAEAWRTYVAGDSFGHVLEDQDGVRTVYVRLNTPQGIKDASGIITLDRLPPLPQCAQGLTANCSQLQVNNGAAVTANRSLSLSLVGLDTQGGSGIGSMRVTWPASGTTTQQRTEPYGSSTVVELPDTLPDGPISVSVVLVDRAGNESVVPLRADIVVDRTPPVLMNFTLTGSLGAGPTSSPALVANYTLTDATVGVSAVALAESAVSCATANHTFALSGPTTFVVGGGDGDKRLYLCARDAAGNLLSTTAVASNNAITLDRVAPLRPTVTLNNGNPYARAADAMTPATVPFSITTPETTTTGYTVRIRGDLAAAGGEISSAFAMAPATLSLAPGAGLRTVVVDVLDAAGNPSSTVTRQLTVDLQAPRVSSILVNGQLALGVPQVLANTASVPMLVACEDDVAPTSALTLRILETTGGGMTSRFSGLHVAPVAVSLGTGTQGARTLRVSCDDPAGNAGVPVTVTVFMDSVAPVVRSFSLNGESPPAVAYTRTPLVTAHYLLQDDGSGVAGAAISSAMVPCAGQPYVLPAQGLTPPVSVPLSGADGDHTLFLCARDRAGNETALPVASSNVVRLDRTPPATASLVLAGGATHTRTNSVSLGVQGAEAGATLQLSGTVAEAGTHLAGAYPATVRLTGPETADQVLVGVLADAAGNLSVPFQTSIRLDLAAPDAGRVTLANGNPVVVSTVVGVLIEATTADTMEFWQASDVTSASCSFATHACGSVPFSPATTVTLSGADGDKRVCWRFCDLAQNSVTGSAPITLGGRPRPVLASLVDSMTPPGDDTVVARVDGNTQLFLGGSGIHPETVALVGDYQLACSSTATAACTSGNPGACASLCTTAALPSTLLRTPGVYPVRLFTPDPVVGGNGTSAETRLLYVRAPPPTLIRAGVTGMDQNVDAASNTLGRPLSFDVCGRCFMDSVAFALGPNVATSSVACESAPTGRPAWCPAGGMAGLPCNNAAAELDCRRITISTAGMLPVDEMDYALRAQNPTPGGGESALPLGVSPNPIGCPAGSACSVSLRGTRANLVEGTGVAATLAVDRLGTGGYASVFGALSASPGTLSGTVQGRTETRGGVVRLPNFRVPEILQLEQHDGQGPRAVVAPPSGAAAVSPGTLSGSSLPNVMAWSTPAARIVSLDNIETSTMELADLDRDGLLDMVVLATSSSQMLVLRNQGGAAPFASTAYNTPGRGIALAVGDVNLDGAQDVVLATQNSRAVGVYLGDGNGAFGAPTLLDMGTAAGTEVAAVLIADVNDDRVPDLVASGPYANNGSELSWRAGQGNGLWSPLTTVSLSGFVSSALTSGDLDLDGRAEVVLFGSATGNFGFAQVRTFRMGAPTITLLNTQTSPVNLAKPFGSARVVVADLDRDGVPDVAAGYTTASDQTGTSTFLSRTMTTQETTDLEGPFAGLDVADVDGDGTAEVLRSGSPMGSGFAQVTLVGSVGGVVNTVVRTTLLAMRVADMGHMSGGAFVATPDGLPDVVFLNTGSANADNIHVMAATQAGVAGSRILDFYNGAFTSIHAADLDHDGLMELLGRAPSGSSSYLMPANVTAAGTLVTRTGLTLSNSTDQRVVAVGDYNADGCVDVVTSSDATGMVLVSHDRNGSFSCLGTHTITTVSSVGSHNVPAGSSLALADLTLDGVPELIRGEGTLSQVRIYRPSLTAPPFGITDTTTLLGFGVGNTRVVKVAVGDVNGDGRPDLIGALDHIMVGGACPAVAVRRATDLALSFAPAQLPDATDVAESVAGLAVADLTGDGRADIVYSGTVTGTRAFISQPDGTFSALALHPQSGDVEMADLDGNGTLDVVVRVEGAIQPIFLRVVSGSLAVDVPAPIPTPVGTAGLIVEDMDQNGAPDVLVSKTTGEVQTVFGAMPTLNTLHLRTSTTVGATQTDGVVRVAPGATAVLQMPASSVVVRAVTAAFHVATASGNPGATRVVLVAPDGKRVRLHDGPAATQCGGTWSSSSVTARYTTDAQACATNGPNPNLLSSIRGPVRATAAGATWALEMTNQGTSAVDIRGATITVDGMQDGWQPGSRHALALTGTVDSASMTSPTGGFMVRRSLAGLQTGVPLGAGSSAGRGHMTEVTYTGSSNATVRVHVQANFNPILEVRNGACASSTAAGAIQLDISGTSPVNRNARVTGLTWAPGAVRCIVVAGNSIAEVGTFDLVVSGN